MEGYLFLIPGDSNETSSVNMSCPLALRKSNFMNMLLFTAELQGDGDVHALFFPTYAFQINKILWRK